MITLNQVLLNVPKQLHSKYLIYKLFNFFEDNLSLQSNLLLKHLDKILICQKKIENVENIPKIRTNFSMFLIAILARLRAL
jgi:hypothetical protein